MFLSNNWSTMLVRIPQTVYKRCLHVKSENGRVMAGAKYMTDVTLADSAA
jgi:hypothetical protein